MIFLARTIEKEEVELRGAFSQDLKESLINFAKGKLDPLEAEKIADNTIKNIDIYNETFAHKGVNSIALKILYQMELSERNI